MSRSLSVMKVFFIILLLFSPFGQAEQKLKRPNPASGPFSGGKIAYDGKYDSQRFPWIENIMAPNHIYMATKCGHLTLTYFSHIKNMWVGNTECHFSVIAIDFHKKEFLGFVDLKVVGRPFARYLASISGEPTEFFEDLQTFKPLGDKKLERLARILTRLSRVNTTFTQNRYVDGLLVLKKRGGWKFDPLGFGFSKPNENWESYTDGIPIINFSKPDKQMGNSLPGMGFGDEFISYKILATSKDINDFVDIKKLDNTIATTLEILWDGYEDLKLNSDEDNKETFRRHIRKNAKTISEELSQLIEQLRKEKFQVMEMVYFLNETSELIAAIDAILLDEVGSDPDFIELIKEKQDV